MIQLVHEPIDHAALIEQVRSNRAGAVVLFLGTVRELTDGRETESLDYEAYPEMARSKLAELETETRQRCSVTELAVVHRLGHLELGEISVAVAVSSPHRATAFEAGWYFIDRIKEVVPIWKQENWKDGTSQWVHPGIDTTPKAQSQP